MKELEKYTKLAAANQVDYNTLLPLYYSFKFNNLLFECQILNHDDGTSYIVNLTANLGYLPYSSENKPRRQELLQELGKLMAQGKIIIDHHCSMTFPLTTVINGQLNAKIIMESILYTLLDAQEMLNIITKILKPSPDIIQSKKQA